MSRTMLLSPLFSLSPLLTNNRVLLGKEEEEDRSDQRNEGKAWKRQACSERENEAECVNVINDCDQREKERNECGTRCVFRIKMSRCPAAAAALLSCLPLSSVISLVDAANNQHNNNNNKKEEGGRGKSFPSWLFPC